MSKYLQAHRALVGDKNNVVIPKLYIDFLNADYYAAMTMRFVVGWSEWAYNTKSREDGKFWKNDKQWLEEEGISLRTINRGIKVINERASAFLGREVEVIKKWVAREKDSNGKYYASNTTYFSVDSEAFDDLMDMLTPLYLAGELRGIDPEEAREKLGTANVSFPLDGSERSHSSDDVNPLHIHKQQTQATDTIDASDEATSAKADANTASETKKQAPLVKDEKPKPKEKPVNGRLKWQVAKLTDAFFRAKGVAKKDISGQARGQTNNVLKQLPPQFDHEDVYAFVKYLETDDWWREPGRLSPSTVVSRIPEWAAKGRPESQVPQRAWEKQGGKIGASDMAELLREYDERNGHEDG